MFAAELSRGKPPAPGRSASTTHVELPAVPTSIVLARNAVADVGERAGMAPERLDALRLAVSEAVTNVVRHAYPERPGEVRLTITAMFEELIVVIDDDGCGPGAPPRSPGLGWGCRLMSLSSDRFTLEPGGRGGTRVSLRFRLRGDRVWSALSASARPARRDRHGGRRAGAAD